MTHVRAAARDVLVGHPGIRAFKPLEEVKLTEGTRVEVHCRRAAGQSPCVSLPLSGVTNANRLRELRF